MSDPIVVGVDAQKPDDAPLNLAARLARITGAPLIDLSREVDLLVCDSRGYGPLRSVLLGGATHRLMRAAHCPVMILPRGTEQPLERMVERQNATTT